MILKFSGHFITESCKVLLQKVAITHGLINCSVHTYNDGRYNFILSWAEAGDQKRLHLVSNKVYNEEHDHTFLDINLEKFVICDFNSNESMSRKSTMSTNSTAIH